MANLLIDHETKTVFPFKSVVTLAHKIGNNTHLEYVNKPIEAYILLGYSEGIIRRKGNQFFFRTSGVKWFESYSFAVVIRTSCVSVEYPIPF